MTADCYKRKAQSSDERSFTGSGARFNSTDRRFCCDAQKNGTRKDAIFQSIAASNYLLLLPPPAASAIPPMTARAATTAMIVLPPSSFDALVERTAVPARTDLLTESFDADVAADTATGAAIIAVAAMAAEIFLIIVM
jgi:hypothetical protein